MNTDKKRSYEELDEKYQTAIDLRVENYRLKYIAGVSGVKEATVAEWFAKGGICHEAYKAKKAERKKEIDERLKTLRGEIQVAAIDSFDTLKAESRGAGMPAIVAAKEIMHMAGYKAPEKLDVNFPSGNVSIKIDVVKNKDDSGDDDDNQPSSD